ncbi:hypothetical protein ACFSCW_13245 [Sphingomonas tabacisoli]|uniref:Uncharacterized protein n=1 Tax=Sphingomonas tabacisoli TaxID=2249466 RepID=A0ABW4I6C6_9SPHN
MNTITVWLLILYVRGEQPIQALAIDNIATEKACNELGEKLVKEADRRTTTSYEPRCYSIEKVR